MNDIEILYRNLFPEGLRDFWKFEGRYEVERIIAYVAGSLDHVREGFLEDLRVTVSYVFWRVVFVLLLGTLCWAFLLWWVRWLG